MSIAVIIGKQTEVRYLTQIYSLLIFSLIVSL